MAPGQNDSLVETIVTNAERMASFCNMLEQRILANRILLARLLPTGQFYELQKSLAGQIEQDRFTLTRITPDNLHRSDAAL